MVRVFVLRAVAKAEVSPDDVVVSRGYIEALVKRGESLQQQKKIEA